MEKPVQKILEELKLKFTNELDGRDRELFIKRLPTTKSHLMQGYRARGPQYDSLPKTLNNVRIPEPLSKTIDGQNFNCGKTNLDCHLFTSSTLCELLSKGDTLYIDGTFGTAPSPFTQILTTRTRVDGVPVTTSFSFLPNKKMATYILALTHLKETAEKEGFLLKLSNTFNLIFSTK